MNDTTLDPFTTGLLSGHANPPDEERDIHQRIAVDTLALTNPVAWREIGARLVAAGISRQQIREEMRIVWAYRKRLRKERKSPQEVAQPYQHDKHACHTL
jgi:hypothetical protein